MAVHVAPAAKPVIVKVRGLAWLTVPLADGVPLVQLTATVTLAELLSEKFLLTVKVLVVVGAVQDGLLYAFVGLPFSYELSVFRLLPAPTVEWSPVFGGSLLLFT